MKKKSFGEFFKKLRINQGQTLRKFCQTNGFDPGNISKLERGLLPAPQSEEKLAQYAKALGLKKGKDDWYIFFDLAAAERGRLPSDLIKNKDLVNKLPVFFHTLRGKKVSDKKLNELIEKIRTS